MSRENIENRLLEELNFIKKQLGEIQEHMVDIDTLLTAEEKEIVSKSFENKKRGKLIKFKDL
ncbi:hypothetical protein EO98_09925 [Methanosarcina sp. 2.H.T.1A.6]|uniref:hypothetical protein n=1 Tax=unclassified Methanosarcina TaxID=2644672 RepID=UPI000621A762|nr:MULTISPECIES: hypothetical protein [unclassified Methanosarcina]KKG14272.1 hypothetical protein EO94_16310 [Methanosarcina sp. 2.H.T.1A.3]KKG16945.1 hypothetical protein EO97_18855 [Methanosarcina sp. 2.H.T.1A.15]KKG19762.1 hypothetical protein EO98_09925 [Methanosarcina sp. 2.H.T.1A.6]KKG27149.1 hypothetical protein EO96_09330 [Methanosarcina sp. 2.H.T.1A.8]